MSSALKFALVLTIVSTRFPQTTPVLHTNTVNTDPKTNPSLHPADYYRTHPDSPLGNLNNMPLVR